MATGPAWANYMELGGSLDPHADTQSPFWSREELAEFARNARARAALDLFRGRLGEYTPLTILDNFTGNENPAS